ncbi:MAG: DNA primase small subunit domain-containing protein [Candidatus Jordarchaeum sp.]|uniref:DNA primase small subunit domain-containing protein n=1 Tax=Candidatus Jordarchaeum sp. TaxID=2823881 RepID=UPI00404A1055
MDKNDFLMNLFGNYYNDNVSKIEPPSNTAKREFGFMFFRHSAVIRHLGFENDEQLKTFLIREAPSDVFYSAASYNQPDMPKMSLKGWEGCDLIFDIDADHIETSCKNEHDKWNCQVCWEIGKGIKPEKCPKCGNSKIEEIKWLCDICLETAKQETIKLVEDFLIPDFGLNETEVSVCFSGHRGYHIHVESDIVRELSSQARREIIDYIKGSGINPELHGLQEVGRKRIIVGPDTKGRGWEGRLARYIIKFISELDENQIQKEDKSVRKKFSTLLKEKQKVVNYLTRHPPLWDAMKNIDINVWYLISERAINMAKVEIDEPVTSDIRRLIRLPTSLNGKTGFEVKPLKLNELAEFDPFSKSQVFKGEFTVYIIDVPRFRIGEEIFGPYTNEKVELPLSAAVFLLCKGVARID